MPTPRHLLVAGVLATILAATPASASQVLHQTLRDLTLSSSDVVVGRVEETSTHWDAAHTRIVTDITVTVSESLKGAPGERLVLSQLGGDLDGFRYSVPGSPLFRTGEEALLFVWRDARGRAQVNGLAQGKFDIRTDAATGVKSVQRAVEGMQVRDVRALALVRPGEAVPLFGLDQLKDEIRTILAEGGR
jgi:hypothetical protein